MSYRTKFCIVCLLSLGTFLTVMPQATAQESVKAEPASEERTADSPESEEEEENTPRYLRSDLILAGALTIGMVHHIDHVLRGNHSGWPFTDQITPFTYSLAVYPLYGTAYALDAGPLSYIVLDSVSSVGLALAHTVLEPPSDQYHPWAHGTNHTGVESSFLGRAAQTVSVGLSIALAGHLISSVFDGVAYGFTWKRRRESEEGATVSTRPVTVPGGGAGVSIAGVF